MELQRMIMGDGKDEGEKKKRKNDDQITEDDQNLTGLTMHPGKCFAVLFEYFWNF